VPWPIDEAQIGDCADLDLPRAPARRVCGAGEQSERRLRLDAAIAESGRTVDCGGHGTPWVETAERCVAAGRDRNAGRLESAEPIEKRTILGRDINSIFRPTLDQEMRLGDDGQTQRRNPFCRIRIDDGAVFDAIAGIGAGRSDCSQDENEFRPRHAMRRDRPPFLVRTGDLAGEFVQIGQRMIVVVKLDRPASRAAERAGLIQFGPAHDKESLRQAGAGEPLIIREAVARRRLGQPGHAEARQRRADRGQIRRRVAQTAAQLRIAVDHTAIPRHCFAQFRCSAAVEDPHPAAAMLDADRPRRSVTVEPGPVELDADSGVIADAAHPALPRRRVQGGRKRLRSPDIRRAAADGGECRGCRIEMDVMIDETRQQGAARRLDDVFLRPDAKPRPEFRNPAGAEPDIAQCAADLGTADQHGTLF